MLCREEIDVALRAVRLAGRICTKVHRTLVTVETIEKKDKSPVTVADLGSQAAISLALQRAFPGDAIVGEEES